MDYRPLNATEAARRFSDVLNQVKYQRAAFEIRRGGEVVARIIPAGPAGLPVAALNRLFASLPALGEDDASAFAADVAAALQHLAPDETVWD